MDNFMIFKNGYDAEELTKVREQFVEWLIEGDEDRIYFNIRDKFCQMTKL